jgi:hypothetical protein
MRPFRTIYNSWTAPHVLHDEFSALPAGEADIKNPLFEKRGDRGDLVAYGFESFSGIMGISQAA